MPSSCSPFSIGVLCLILTLLGVLAASAKDLLGEDSTTTSLCHSRRTFASPRKPQSSQCFTPYFVELKTSLVRIEDEDFKRGLFFVIFAKTQLKKKNGLSFKYSCCLYPILIEWTVFFLSSICWWHSSAADRAASHHLAGKRGAGPPAVLLCAQHHRASRCARNVDHVHSGTKSYIFQYYFSFFLSFEKNFFLKPSIAVSNKIRKLSNFIIEYCLLIILYTLISL